MGLHDLKISTKGIMVTANFLDYGCKREVFSILDEYCDGIAEKKVVDAASADVTDDIASEIAELNKTKKRFEMVDTTLNNLMFIAVRQESLDVTDIVHSILTNLRETKQRKTRFMQRILPVTHTCYSAMDDIAKTAKAMLEGIMYNKTPKTFGIMFKCRNNSSMKRDEVIDVVASIATDGGIYEEFTKVDLNNPEYTVVINIVKTAVLMGVVKDFNLLSKYNIDELTKGFIEPETDGRVADAEKPAESAVDNVVDKVADNVVTSEDKVEIVKDVLEENQSAENAVEA